MSDIDKPDRTDPDYALGETILKTDRPLDPMLGVSPEVAEMDGSMVTDWGTFHDVSASVFGFPRFYGRNINAWIDCMSDLRERVLDDEILVAVEWALANQRIKFRDLPKQCT